MVVCVTCGLNCYGKLFLRQYYWKAFFPQVELVARKFCHSSLVKEGIWNSDFGNELSIFRFGGRPCDKWFPGRKIVLIVSWCLRSYEICFWSLCWDYFHVTLKSPLTFCDEVGFHNFSLSEFAEHLTIWEYSNGREKSKAGWACLCISIECAFV